MPRRSTPARKRREQVMYRVWRPDTDPDATYAVEYGALDHERAARLYADHYHAGHTDLGVDGWPIVFYVQASNSSRVFCVEVTMQVVPEFVPGRALAIDDVHPQVHALWHGDPLCDDPRLRGYPAKWPTGQTWISVLDIGRDITLRRRVTCTGCKKQIDGKIAGLRQIGALS